MIDAGQFRQQKADRAFDCSNCKSSISVDDSFYWFKGSVNKAGSNTRVCVQCAEAISTKPITICLSEADKEFIGLLLGTHQRGDTSGNTTNDLVRTELDEIKANQHDLTNRVYELEKIISEATSE